MGKFNWISQPDEPIDSVDRARDLSTQLPRKRPWHIIHINLCTILSDANIAWIIHEHSRYFLVQINFSKPALELCKLDKNERKKSCRMYVLYKSSSLAILPPLCRWSILPSILPFSPSPFLFPSPPVDKRKFLMTKTRRAVSLMGCHFKRRHILCENVLTNRRKV